MCLSGGESSREESHQASSSDRSRHTPAQQIWYDERSHMMINGDAVERGHRVTSFLFLRSCISVPLETQSGSCSNRRAVEENIAGITMVKCQRYQNPVTSNSANKTPLQEIRLKQQRTMRDGKDSGKCVQI